jgi:hypothetical protein
MDELDLPLRSPTAMAWTLAILSLVGTGELAQQIQVSEVPIILSRPFAADELAIPMFLLCCVTFLLWVWLASLYLRPGRIRLSLESSYLSRVVRPFFRSRTIRAPINQWSCAILYFSDDHRKRHLFKQVELQGPSGFSEVLIFADLKNGDVLAQHLEHLTSQFKSYREIVQIPDDMALHRSPDTLPE